MTKNRVPTKTMYNSKNANTQINENVGFVEFSSKYLTIRVW